MSLADDQKHSFTKEELIHKLSLPEDRKIQRVVIWHSSANDLRGFQFFDTKNELIGIVGNIAGDFKEFILGPN